MGQRPELAAAKGFDNDKAAFDKFCTSAP